MNGSKISSIEYYFPKKRENNKTLKKFNPKLDIKKMKEKTGIDNRYISDKKENVLDLSIKCSKKIFKKFSGYKDYSHLNFSPKWREDYKKINFFRLRLYFEFIFWKFRYHPLSLLRQPFNLLQRKFNTKMEMVLYRALHTLMLIKSSVRRRSRRNT